MRVVGRRTARYTPCKQLRKDRIMNSTRFRRVVALAPMLGALAACSAPATTTAVSPTPVVQASPTAVPSTEPSVAASPSASVEPSTAASPSSSAGPSPSDAASTHAAIPSTQIVKDYEADQTAADATYQGKRLLIRGNVTNINDVFGTQALLLRDSEDEVGVQCYLTTNADAAKVQVGEEVTVAGVVRGGELGFFMVVDECVVR